MPQPPAAPPANPIPLVVDLDGTLIETDLLWESLARLLRRNPFSLFAILFWWTRGRARLKQQLARRVQIDPAALPYNHKFLDWLREQKSAGRKIFLATASDLRMARPVADHVGIFDEVLGSDGKTNLRGGNKLKVLVQKFGERGFDYAGNSAADLAVWRGAREAIVVNASRSIAKQAAACAKPGASFPEYSRFGTLRGFLNELFIHSGYLAAIAAGLLLTAAFPKIGVAGFAWIAPALMVFAARGKSGDDAFRVGCVAGLAHFLSSLYWLLLMPVAGYPILGWVALSAYLALFFGVWTWLVSPRASHSTLPASWSGRLLWALGGAAGWVALEMLRGWLLGGFPWNFIGASQSPMVPLIQIASVTGVYGVSFLVVWASLLLFSAAWMIFQKPAVRFIWQAEILLPFAVVVGLFVFGEIRLERGRSAREFQAADHAGGPPALLRVTLIQPGFPQTLIWDENQNASRFRELIALSKNALTNPTDLLVWPESAVPEFNNETLAAITNLVRSRRVWLIFNADDVVPRPDAANEFDNDAFNAAFLFAPDGRCAGIYHKQKLVIFGEYIPLARWLPFVKWFTPITGGFEAGNASAQFEMQFRDSSGLEVQINTNNAEAVSGAPGRVVASPLICFEDTFSQLARKASSTNTDFLVNLTNDGWFGDSAEQWQHEQGAIFRAVENGIPLVRCCNNGITCWIGAHGRVREIFQDKTSSVYGAGAMTIELPLSSRAPTFYNRHGDWFGWGCVAVAFGLLLARIKSLVGNKRTV
jgi:apolipoprotein N-acyltransferase